MPSGPRIRANNVFGLTTDNPLTNGATSFNSPSLFLLPEVSSAHAVVVLDPKRVNGEPEIVVVTAHTALATSATITRGAYGTMAREHPAGTHWAHVVVADDEIPIVTSGTRPGDPYRGQLIFETDTNKYVGRSTTDAWVDAVPLGAWQTYSPVWTQSTVVGQTTTYATYTRMGRFITANVHILASGGGTASNTHNVTLPVAPANSAIEFGRRIVGTGQFKDTSDNQYFPLHVLLAGGGSASVVFESSDIIVGVGSQFFGLHGNTSAAAANDQIQFTVTYEAAS